MKRRLGIIGGAGPLASALLYEKLVKNLYSHNKKMLEILLINYPFSHPPLDGNLDSFGTTAQKELQICVNRLLSAEIDLAVVVCNTLHAYLDKMEGGIRFISLLETVKEEIVLTKVKKVLVLGTSITKKEGLYTHKNYETVFPSVDQQHRIDQLIENILNGLLMEEEALFLEQVVHEMWQQKRIDGVVLGCTELPVLHEHYPLKFPCPLFDSVKILANHLTRDTL